MTYLCMNLTKHVQALVIPPYTTLWNRQNSRDRTRAVAAGLGWGGEADGKGEGGDSVG